MNIGIDIDGVLTDIESFEFEKGKIYFNKDVVNPKGAEVYEMFDVSREDDDTFWADHILEYAKDYPARAGASKITNKFHNEGYKLTIITARSYYPEYTCMEPDDMPKIVEKWLLDNGIYYDNIIYTKGSKLPYVKNANIDIMIEDSPKNIMDIVTYCPVIIMDAGCNRDIACKNAFHAKNWNGVYNIIKNN
jgi:uncharacterized HAD superfamily protein